MLLFTRKVLFFEVLGRTFKLVHVLQAITLVSLIGEFPITINNYG